MSKNSYSARINQRLAEMIINPMTLAAYRFGGKFDIHKEFQAVDASGKPTAVRLSMLRYNPAGQICDLCGHNPINRIFGVEVVKTGKVMEVGSECIKNWVGADIAAGLAKALDAGKNAIVNEDRLANEIAAFNKVIEDSTSKKHEVKTANYLLSRIRSGILNPITDSYRRFTANALRKYGYKVVMVPRFGKLLKEIEPAIKVFKTYRDECDKLSMTDRYTVEGRKQRHFYYNATHYINQCEYAKKYYQDTGVIKNAEAKIIRNLIKDKKLVNEIKELVVTL